MKRAPPRHPSPSQLAKQVRDAAKDPANVFFTAHAEQEMQADSLTALEVLQALRGCVVTEVQPAERLKAEGRTATGQRVACVIQLLEVKSSRLRVITVWRITPR
jgi:DNA-binding LytR/AlgR family response regulator